MEAGIKSASSEIEFPGWAIGLPTVSAPGSLTESYAVRATP